MNILVNGMTLTIGGIDRKTGAMDLVDSDGNLYHVRLRDDVLAEQANLILAASQEEALKSSAIVAAPVVATAATVLEVHVNDAICLKPKNDVARKRLDLWGYWWKVQTGYRKGEEWLLNSISKQPRAIAASKYESLIIRKVNDPDYEIVNVCQFPREFHYKEWKDKVAP
jgi:hypothetical protein